MSDGPGRPDKVLWPQAGFTKQDLWDYVDAVADRLLAAVRDRPLTLKRFPDGVDAGGFFQKDTPEWAPAHLRRHRQWSESADRYVEYAVAGGRDDLRWLADMAAIELHVMPLRTDQPDRPDTLVFDLDPGDGSASAPQAARWLRETLEALGLPSLVKTSGKRGLHVLVPVERRYDFGQARGLALAVGRATVAAHPRELTVEMRKARRRGRLLLDWSRNGHSQTVVAAWSPRATPEGTVATPLHWHEVTDDLDPTAFTLATAPGRDDPWAHPPPPVRLEQARDALVGQGFTVEDRSPRSSQPVE